MSSSADALIPRREALNFSDLLEGRSTGFCVTDATLVLPDRIIENGYLEVVDGRIAAIGEGESPSRLPAFSAGGDTVMAGIIDLHSDALEKYIQPRPGSKFPLEVAILEFDKALAACGITTMYHCVALMDAEFGSRTIEGSSEMIDELSRLRERLLTHSKIHARYDLPSPESLPTLLEKMDAGKIHLVSLMDHTPGQGQYRDLNVVIKKRHPGDEEAGRREVFARIEAAKGKIREEDVAQLVDACHAHSIPLASHDDESVEKVRYGYRHNVAINEFPVCFEAAREARALGQPICLGAPNALRGLSHSGNLSVREAIRENLCDILCSDYAPMSLLQSVFLLEKLGLTTLPEAAALVSLNAANAAGIGDETGSLEEGKAADFILVNRGLDTPRMRATFVSGRMAYGAAIKL